MKKLILFLLVSTLILACEKDKFEEQTLIVADHKESCTEKEYLNAC